MERFKSNTITIEQQRAEGLTRQTTNFVPAVQRRRDAPPMPVNSQVAHVIDVAPTATQHIEMKTSAVDRAKGFLIASVPLYAAFALAVVAVVVLGWNVPLWSFPTLIIFWLSFVAAWVVGYAYTLSVSAEGVSLWEAKAKWRILEREQEYRWRHYERQIGMDGE
ncbi:MAG TPA: hypothetical protein PKA43_00240 [Candidatus Competibacter phosphatis]|nr:hypothetical protein [Candidatus Competibacter phosphatis]